jgi:hypothetical protein
MMFYVLKKIPRRNEAGRGWHSDFKNGETRKILLVLTLSVGYL